MVLTLRDLALLEALFTAIYLSTPQIQALFWRESKGGSPWGRVKACQQRLRKLYQAGLVRRISLPVKKGEKLPYIYSLTPAGAKLVSSELGLELTESDWRPKVHEEHYPFMAHLLATTDIRIAIREACLHAGVALAEWVDERALRAPQQVAYVTLVGPEGSTSRSACIPDGYFKLCRQDKCGLFFVETDMKTVTIAPSRWERKSWMKKIRTYAAWLQSEAYHTQYEGRPARVLTICGSQTRLTHLRQATETVFAELRRAGEETGIQGLFWFGCFAEVLMPEQVLTAPIWQVAGVETRHALLE